MNKQIFTMLVFITSVGTLPALAAPCVAGTFATYESLGSQGCTIGGNVTVNNFDYMLSAALLATNINAADILVTPTVGADGPVLTFAANWNAGGVLVSTYTGLLRFTATADAGSFIPFDGQTLAITGSTTGVASLAAVSETLCVGGLLGPNGLACLGGGVVENLGAQLSGSSTSANATVTFGQNNVVDVFKTIVLTGAAGGNAHLSSFSQSFSTANASDTPEPFTTALVGGGLVGIGLLRRRSLKSKKV